MTGAPWPFVIGLAGALLIGLTFLSAARALVRTRPDHAARIETAALAAAGCVGLVLLFQNVLVHDALWYYSYLRSAVVNRDLDLYDEFVLRNPNGMYLPPPGTPIFHLGTPILVLPFALAARPAAILLGRAGLVPGGDGYGPVEVLAATLGSALLGLGGIVLAHRLARRFAGGGASAIAQIALLYASPMVFFTFVWPGYPHAATVLVASAFLLVWARDGPAQASGRALLLGVLAGILALVHPQDILYLALPGLDLMAGCFDRRTRTQSLAATALLVTGAGCGFAPQLSAWVMTSGRLIPHVYAEIGDPFRWSRPALLDTLFSTYNGLLVWAPLCGVALAGLLLLRRDHPRIFRGLLLLFVLEWWAISSYGYWWGGASFGPRYFLSAYPVFCVGLGLALGWTARRIGLLAAGLATVPFVYWNLLLLAQFRLEWIPHNRPPDFVQVLGRQISDAPVALARGLVGDFRFNQVLALETLRSALAGGSAREPLLWIGCVAAGLGTIFWCMHRLGAMEGDEPPSARWGAASRRAPALVATGACVLATLGVLSIAHGHERERLRAEVSTAPLRIRGGQTQVLPFSAPADGPTADEPTGALGPRDGPTGPAESLRVDLISFLHNGERLEEGETAARLRLQGPGCGDLGFPLRAGYETAETAPGRIEIEGSVRHGIERTIPVHSWFQDDFSSRGYIGHAYLASWPVRPGCKPDRAVVEVSAGPSDLEIRRLALAGVRSVGR